MKLIIKLTSLLLCLLLLLSSVTLFIANRAYFVGIENHCFIWGRCEDNDASTGRYKVGSMGIQILFG